MIRSYSKVSAAGLLVVAASLSCAGPSSPSPETTPSLESAAR